MKSLILLLVVVPLMHCEDTDLMGASTTMDTNGDIPGFGDVLKTLKIQPMIEITGVSKQLVAGTLYKVKFNTGPKSCFGENGYSNSDECYSKKKICQVTYLIQPWKKDSLTIVGDVSNICKGTEVTQAKQNVIDPDLHQEPYNRTTDKHLRNKFDEFITTYGRTYRPDSNDGEYWKRFSVFKQNVEKARIFNKKEMGRAKYGITKFMDYTEMEYRQYLAPGFTDPIKKLRKAEFDYSTATPDSFDWRDHGAVTPVKNQGTCGSCWAFSTTGNIEGQWAIKKGKLISLSEQELVDCDTTDQGCNGGLPSNAYISLEKLGGLETEREYPYDGRKEKCNFKRSDVVAYVNDSVQLPTDEGKLASWLAANGPISIGINANAMQVYIGGVSHPWRFLCNPKNLDHGVLIVGYGYEEDTPYWLIKNSWGPDWGEKGYYRIYRGDGSCGVNLMATSAIVD